MSLNTDKQFAGNYVRLVNQSRTLQQNLQRMTEAFDNSTQLNNKLHDEIRLKDKMIELMIDELDLDGNTKYCSPNERPEMCYEYFKSLALSELVTEQNKKAADSASI